MGEALQSMTREQLLVGIRAMSANTALNQLELNEKTLMKAHLEVELNEFLQEKLESDLFEGVDEESKARFIGNFFSWVRNIFSAKTWKPMTIFESKEEVKPKQQAAISTVQET